MNKETIAILKSLEDLADYLEYDERKKTFPNLDRIRPLRRIKDRIYTILNPMPEGQEGNCCEMPERKGISFIGKEPGQREEFAKSKDSEGYALVGGQVGEAAKILKKFAKNKDEVNNSPMKSEEVGGSDKQNLHCTTSDVPSSSEDNFAKNKDEVKKDE